MTSLRRLKRYAGHVVLKLASLTVGAAYISPAGDALRRTLDASTRSPVFSGQVAVVAHVFYPELLGEIVRCHSFLPQGSGLIVTTPAAKARIVGDLLAGVANAEVVVVENRGRDIAPFVRLLDEGFLDGYDAVLKLHTKRSPHLRDGDIRRRLLFAALAGSRRRVARVLALFEEPVTGAVGWRMAWRNSERFWMANRDRVEALAARMNLFVPDAPAFFEGSMFWVRPAALQRLRELRLRPEDFEPEAGQLDATLHHALERVFDLVIRGDGMATRDVRGRELTAAP